MNVWIRLPRRVEQLISTWNSNQLRITFNPQCCSHFVMTFNRFEPENHIISMPPTLSQQRVFLSCFHAAKTIKIPPNSETWSRLNSIYAHKYDPDSPHPGLGVHSLSGYLKVTQVKCSPSMRITNHSGCHGRLKGDVVCIILD